MKAVKKIMMIFVCGSFMAFSAPIKAEYDYQDLSTLLKLNLKKVLRAAVGA